MVKSSRILFFSILIIFETGVIYSQNGSPTQGIHSAPVMPLSNSHYAPYAEGGSRKENGVSSGVWVKEQSVENVVHAISFADSLTGYMAGEFGVVYKSTDGGATWPNVLNLGDQYYWYGMHVFSADTVIVGGFTYKNNNSGYSIIRWTMNGGSTWTDDIVIDTTSLNWIMGLDFVDANHGLAIGNSGQVYITSNGGVTGQDWTRVIADTAKGFFMGDFTMFSDGHYFISGGSFCTSDNYGVNWTKHLPADSSYDIGINFSDPLHGWTGGGDDLFGSSGWMHRTTDGGSSWSPKIFSPPYPVENVYFFDTLNGLAVGGNLYSENIVGGIWSTIDGGENWTNDLDTDSDSIGMEELTWHRKGNASLDIWAVGSSPLNGWHSTVYKKSDVATSIKAESLSENIILQNYPNPFSGTTTISYTLSKAGKVELTVYDLLGREVEKLVDNEFKSVGTYSIRFNENILAGSNCYFCKLRSGDFTTTCKMISLKQE